MFDYKDIIITFAQNQCTFKMCNYGYNDRADCKLLQKIEWAGHGFESYG
jgi:hypothetical protein